jgi:hypothetical protein
MRCNIGKLINSWQGWQFGNRTFTDDIEVDVKAVRDVLDEVMDVEDGFELWAD